MTENEISKLILDSAIAVHKELGPGLLESVYEVVLTMNCSNAGFV
jgi:GxxExxY protein